MNAKQWAIIGAVMALCGNDPFRELRRITRDAR